MRKGDKIAVEVQGMTYHCPPLPALKEIRGYNLPKKDQVWFRDTTYEQFSWNTERFDEERNRLKLWWEDPAEGQMEWYEQEMDRIVNSGCWVMINGEPTFFNKYAYFFHSYFTLLIEQIYPTYKDTSLEYFRFVELCESDRGALGDIGIKGRRVGLSSMAASMHLQIGIIENNTLQGIVSKTGTDAYEMYLMIKNGLENLPPFFVPELNKVTDSEIHIAKQQRKISANNKTVTADKGLNNRINWLDTAENAYDGRKARRIIVDECLLPETKIMIDGYSFKAIKDVNVGDYVIVEGGKRVRVAKKFEGQDEMFLIKQPYSLDYVVSSKHRLYLEQRARVKSIKDDGVKTWTPLEFLSLGKYKKRTTHGLRSSGLDFEPKDHLISPYVFGAWLGDGVSSGISFVVNFKDDVEIYNHLHEYGESIGYDVSEYYVKHCKKVVILTFKKKIASGQYNPNKLRDELKRLAVFNDKNIPDEYMYDSRENRLELLAGLIDTDGFCNTKKNNITIGMSRENLVNQISFLCRSLGFSVSVTKKNLTNLNTNSYKICISGDLSIIPMKVERKKFTDYVQTAKFRRNRIEVEPIGLGDYIGIQVESDNDDDRRLILEDFTLTMNCGKFEKVNVRTLLSKISETLVVGSSVSGYISLFSTVNKGDKGGDNFRKIWDGSDHINGKKDRFGRTETKLKRFFIPGYRGLLGYIDKYGNSVVNTPTPEQRDYLSKVIDPSTGQLACLDPTIGAKEYLEEARKMKAHDPELYAEQVRMYPFEWQEVFKGSNNMCHFDLDELNKQIELIEDELREKQISENGRRVTWKESPNGDAYFVDDPKGISFLLEILPPEQANLRQMVGSTLVPMHTAYGAAGLDPYANSQKTAELGSDACLMIHSRYNPLFPDTTGMPVAMILGRLPTKDDFYNQCKLMLRYYGIAMLAERAPTDWEDYFIRHHLADPLEVKEDRMGYLHTTLRTGKTEVYGVAPQDANLREAHLTYMKEYARNNMHKIKFLRLLKDMLAFNLKDRLLYDACLAWGYALIALSVTVDEPKDPEREEPMIQTFDLSAA